MAAEIKLYGNEALRRRAVRVEAVDDRIRALAREMLDTMYASGGLGLAAGQIGRDESICVIDIPPPRESEADPPCDPTVPMPLVLVNPEIVEEGGEQTGQEGCLSFPEIYVNIKRAQRVKVRHLDLDNRPAEVEADGLLSRAIQHELDHLGGVLLVDRMSAVQRVGVAGKLKRLKKQGREQA